VFLQLQTQPVIRLFQLRLRHRVVHLGRGVQRHLLLPARGSSDLHDLRSSEASPGGDGLLSSAPGEAVVEGEGDEGAGAALATGRASLTLISCLFTRSFSIILSTGFYLHSFPPTPLSTFLPFTPYSFQSFFISVFSWVLCAPLVFAAYSALSISSQLLSLYEPSRGSLFVHLLRVDRFPIRLTKYQRSVAHVLLGLQKGKKVACEARDEAIRARSCHKLAF
jgi:hypothetical protein